MASIEGGGDSGGHKKGPGVKKAKKLSTRVDMTPMVDLGFLLITFFIFTTTMSTPTTMDLIMPEDKDEEKVTEVKQSGSLTILLGKGDQVYYYEGILTVNATTNNFKATTFKGIREVIINKKKQVIAAHVHDQSCEKLRQDDANIKNLPEIDPNSCLDRDLVVIIKPDENANYKNTVDILDEMAINGISRYAIVDPFPDELKLVKATETSKGIK